MSIVEKLSAKQAKRVQNSLQQYRVLLKRLSVDPGEPSSEDIENLDALCSELKIDAEQAEHDLGALKTYIGLQPIAENMEGKKTAWIAENRKVQEHTKQIESAMKQLQAEHLQFEKEQTRSRGEFDKAAMAQTDLKNLRFTIPHTALCIEPTDPLTTT